MDSALFKSNAKWFIPVALIFIALHIGGNGKVGSWQIPDIAIYAVLAVLYYIFDLLRKDLRKEKAKNLEGDKEKEGGNVFTNSPSFDFKKNGK